MTQYQSTRDAKVISNAKNAILQGLSKEGGLFVTNLKDLQPLNLERLLNTSYQEVAFEVMKRMLDGYQEEELKSCIQEAYGTSFDTEEITPLVCKDDLYVLELFHGPTQAFKDVGLQMLPQLMKKALHHQNICILTATSGDTGKAALCGFENVDQIQIQIFYPHQKVSTMQYLQMATQTGNNVNVCAIEGNFDDAQTAVKKILEQEKEEKGVTFSSANSINIGRLVPQMVYYVYSYLKMVERKEIALYEPVNFCVPTGNFGNVLAGYYAKQLGLPVHKFIVASNENHVLYDFFQTGCYNRNRKFHTTISPSMDILISSNLERLLYAECKQKENIKHYMQELNEKGSYQISSALLQSLQQQFAYGYASKSQTEEAILEAYQKYGYVMDPHTAVGYHVMKQNPSPYKTILLATASPYKFATTVLRSLHIEPKEDVFEQLVQLQQITNVPIPKPLAQLKNKEILHHDVINKEEIYAYVKEHVKGDCYD